MAAEPLADSAALFQTEMKMDDATFELLKRIDEGFEEGGGPYGRDDLDEILNQPNNSRGQALIGIGNEGLNLRMAIMEAVEAEKARRAIARDSGFSCPALQAVFP